MKKFFPILIITFFLVANFVEAVAVKVKPSEIKIEAEVGVLTKEEIIIENPDNNVALFEVYLDNFSDWIKIKPGSFILESKKSQKVVLEIKNQETGIFSTTVSVVAKPLSERQFKANSGIKIPLEIKISEERAGFWLASILRSFGKLAENQQNLIYISSIIFILVLFGLLARRKNKILKK